MRTNKNTKLSALITVGVLAVVVPSLLITPAFAGVSAQAVSFQYKLTAGKTYTYTTTMRVRTSAPQIATNMSADTIHKIDKVNSSGFSTTTTIKKVKITVAGVAQPNQFEGSKVTMSYDQYGHATSRAQGNARLVAAINSFGNSVGFNGMPYPKTPVSVGGGWSINMDMKEALAAQDNPLTSMMKIKSGGKVPVKFILKSITAKGTKRIATIDATMKGKIIMEMDMSGTGAEVKGGKAPQKMEMTMLLDGKMKFTINLTDGMVQTGSSIVDVDMMVMGQAIKQTMNVDVKLK